MAFSTINKSADHFAPLLYSSNGTAIGSGGLTVTGFDFPPDWLGLKQRDAAESWGTYDAVRGITKSMRFNGSEAADTRTEGITAFNSNGFTCGSDSRINPSGTNPMIAYGWKAGTTSGIAGSPSITPTSYSFNTTGGFSIIKWTANSTGLNTDTLPHGLGVAPSMIIIKCTSDADSWIVYTKSQGAGKQLFFNATSTVATNANKYPTTPTSTLFYPGSDNSTNNGSRTYIAYCFAEIEGYSKFSKYIGNANTDGTFVYTGFKPTFVLCKGAISGDGDAGQNWELYDNARQGFNVMGPFLQPNIGNAESTGTRLDILSNGFKVRVNSDGLNDNNSTYIYAAFGQPIISNSGITATGR